MHCAWITTCRGKIGRQNSPTTHAIRPAGLKKSAVLLSEPVSDRHQPSLRGSLAVRRENVLAPLQAYLSGLLDEQQVPVAAADRLRETLDKAVPAVSRAMDQEHGEYATRQAATALYYTVAAFFMGWEAARQAPDYRRLAIAHLVLRSKLMPTDPFASEPQIEPGLQQLLLSEQPMTLVDAMRLLP